jgi:tetratricopeptide (TPR) repeat protein
MNATQQVRLRQARLLAAQGAYRAAQACYVELLQEAPLHVEALAELGAVAHADGYRSAARTVFRRVVALDPRHMVAHLGLGGLAYDDGDLAASERHYRAALATDPSQAMAHQGLARVLCTRGDAAAETHFEAGFRGHAVVRQPYFGSGPGVPVLMLVSARGGNLHVKPWLDDRVYAVTAVYADYWEAGEALPPHALILNAIGDADLCGAALDAATRLVAASGVPVLNPPDRVRHTTRAGNAAALADVAGVMAPAMLRLRREAVEQAACLGFPLLLRAPGFHTGQFLVRVDRPEDLAGAAARLPTPEVLAIRFLDACGADGWVRKYRVMFIDGGLYPLHLAVSADWKVHYFSAGMAACAAHRAEEQRFLADMAGVLGGQAMAALREIQARLGLAYAGIDFGLAPDGRLLLFEANATMIMATPDADPMWDYRRPAIDAAVEACRRMLGERLARRDGVAA